MNEKVAKNGKAWKRTLTVLVGTALLCGGWNAMEVAAGNGLEVKKDDATVYTAHKEDIAIGDKVNIYGTAADTDAGKKIEKPKSIGIGYGIDIGATGSVPGNVFGANVYALGENIKVWAYRSLVMGENLNVGVSDNVKANKHRAWQTNNVVLGYNSKVYRGHAISIGSDNDDNGQYSVGIGNNLKLAGSQGASYNVAIGNKVTVAEKQSIGIGYNVASGQRSVVIGDSAQSNTLLGVAIGAEAKVLDWEGVAIGYQAKTIEKNGGRSIAIGKQAKAESVESIAMGFGAATSGGSHNIAIGTGTVAGGDNITEATAVGKGAKATGKYSTAFGGSTKATAESALALGSSAHATGKGSVAAGLYAKAKFEGSVALGKDSEATVNKGVTGYNVGEDAASTLAGNAWTSTLASVAIGKGGEKTRQLTGLAAGTDDTDAVNVAQLKAAKVKVEVAKDSQLTLKKETPTAAGTTYTLDISKDGTMEGDKAKNLVTGETVKTYVDGQVNEAKAEAKKHTTVVAGDNITISDKANAAGGKEYTVKVNADGAVANGNTGIVTGGKVYNAIKDKADTTTVNSIKTEIEEKLNNKANKNLENLDEAGKKVVRDLAKESVKVINGTNTTVEEDTEGNAKTYKVNVSNDAIKAAVAEDLSKKVDKTELANYAQNDGSNITEPGKWAEKLGTGSVAKDDKNLITGDTVYKALQGDISESNTTKGVTGAKIKEYVDGQLAGNKVTVEAGNHVTVTSTDNADGSKKYTVAVKTDGTVTDGNTGIVSGGTVYNAIKDKVDKADLNSYAKTDATNIDAEKWVEKLGTGNVADKDKNLVTGGTVYNAIKDKANNSLSNLTEAGKTEIKTLAKEAVKVGNGTNTTVETEETNGVTTYKVNVTTTGKVEENDTGIVTGDTVYNAIKDKVNKTDLNNYAKTDATNIDAEKWAKKLGTGNVADKDKNLVTGGTVYNAIKDKANTSLSNLTEAGKTEIKSLAKQAVKVGAGTNTTVETEETNGVTTYKVNVATGGKVEENDTGIVSGGTVYNAIKNKVNKDDLNGYAKTDATNIDAGKWAEKLGTGNVADQDKNLVTGGTVKAALDNLAGATNLTEENVTAWRDKLGSGEVKADDLRLVNGDTVHKAIEANKTTVEGDEEKGLTVTQTGNAYKVSLGDKAKLGSVSIDGTKGKETIAVGDTLTMNQKGIALKDGPKLTVAGVDAGSKVIINVADGKEPTDAVNMRQFMGLSGALTGRMNEVGAGAAALAALHPLDYDPDNKWDMAVGYGNYRGTHAASLGAYYRPNEYTLFSLGGSIGGGDNMVNVGVSLKMGRKERDGVIASKADMDKEIKVLKAQNKAIIEKSQKMESENQEMKKELEELKAQVAQLLDK